MSGSVLVAAADTAGKAVAEARDRRVRRVTFSTGDRSTRGAEQWRQEHTGCRTVGTEAHAGAEQKHWVPGEGRTEARAGAKQVRGCKYQMPRTEQATGGRTEYIHGLCARQDPWAYARDYLSGLTPGDYTTRLPFFFCFVLNQLFGIPLHAARRAMAAAACRCPSQARKQQPFPLHRYTPFLPPDQLTRS